MMSEPITESGPWSVCVDNKGSPIIVSDDFTHEAWLRPSGDFASTSQKLAYCEEIARRLNEWSELATLRAERAEAERDALRAEVELWKERAYQLSHA